MELVNEVTRHLKPYPMEELGRIRRRILANGQRVFDFGTGDPKLETADFIHAALKEGIETVSQYPSILGGAELTEAHQCYLTQRFEISSFDNLAILPTRGSKEAIFHILASVVGQHNRKTVAYPVPGYPVYEASCDFFGANKFPYLLAEDSGYLVRPWDFPENVQRDLAALWINYPHNPSGEVARIQDLAKIVDWCKEHQVLLLSDECYVDIYNSKLDQASRPRSVLEITHEGVISFMSLSKRSGMTGFRAGFMAGDQSALQLHSKARARFGLAQPAFIQKAAAAAWSDESHVEKRRQIFTERLELLGSEMQKLGLITKIPQATFYIWAKVPDCYSGRDVEFCKDLAEECQILVSPSSWLGDPQANYFRLACVPTIEETAAACSRLNNFIQGRINNG